MQGLKSEKGTTYNRLDGYMLKQLVNRVLFK